MAAGKHEKAVNEYVKGLTQFGESHPIIVGLKVMAQELDNKFMTSLAQQLQMTLRYIEGVERAGTEEKEEEDELLSSNR